MFDLKYKLAADYNIILSFYQERKNFYYVSYPISVVTMDVGQTANNSKLSDYEVREIKIKSGINIIICYFDFYKNRFRKSIVKILVNLLPKAVVKGF